MRNALDQETSPYLLQHKDNPVHWQPWDKATFAAARTANKPVLLSVGYAACHWCHVMAHESFENDAIAGLMNDLFVNIKVDREERPDVDAIYQAALSLIGQHGGWPLTMFLTPDGEPFWGGTYFPAAEKYGRAAFPDILRRVSQVFHEEPDAVAKNKAALTDALQRLGKPPEGAQAFALTPDILDQVAHSLAKEVDPHHGGIGQAPKFPQPYAFETLWRAWLRSRDDVFRQAVEHSLSQMCQGGIYDHLRGGFARYSTDEKWLAPHFEKMLYDNAQLVDLMTMVWQGTGNPLYKVRVAETIGWLQTEMLAEGGAFAASLDADSEGVEGRFYVWQEAEIDAALGAGADLFKQAYDVTGRGNWEHANILNRSHHLALADETTEERLAAARETLLALRAGRIRPGWDDKILADWNGLMIAALANAGFAFDRPEWTAMAETAFDAVIALMSDGDRLCHAYRDGRRQKAAMLDDYANMARAAVALHEMTGKAGYLEHARRWFATLDAHYWDAENGGYFYSADDAGDLIARLRHCQDNAVPAGNATAAAVLVRLWLLTGDENWHARADAILQAFSPELQRNFFPMTSYVNSLDLMLKPLQVVIAGTRGSPDTEALLRAVAAAALPNRILQVVGPQDSLPDTHPAAGKGQVDGRAAAYVCVGQTCSLPATDPAALAEALAAAT